MRSHASRIAESALSTPRGNTAAGLGLLVGALLLFTLVRWLENAGPKSVFGDVVWVTLGVGFVSAAVLGGLVLLAQPARRGLGRAAAIGSGAYLLVGLALLATGIPGYVPSGAWYVLPTWPMLVIWLHACTLGTGLWPCPPG